MKKSLIVFACALGILFLAGCAPGVNPMENNPQDAREVAGFLLGVWHGMICIVTFIISLFNDNVQMYEVVNNGTWYNLGFLIGASGALGGGIASAKR